MTKKVTWIWKSLTHSVDNDQISWRYTTINDFTRITRPESPVRRDTVLRMQQLLCAILVQRFAGTLSVVLKRGFWKTHGAVRCTEVWERILIAIYAPVYLIIDNRYLFEYYLFLGNHLPLHTIRADCTGRRRTSLVRIMDSFTPQEAILSYIHGRVVSNNSRIYKSYSHQMNKIRHHLS